LILSSQRASFEVLLIPRVIKKLYHPSRMLIKLEKKSVASHTLQNFFSNQLMLYIRDFSTHQSWLLKFNNNFKALNDISQQSLCRFTRNFLSTRMPSFHNENYDVINKRKCLSLFAPFTIFPLVFFSFRLQSLICQQLTSDYIVHNEDI